MVLRRRKYLYPVLSLIVLILVSAMRFLPARIIDPELMQYLRHGIVCAMILLWAASASSRIYHPQIRIFHAILVALLLMMQVFRGFRHLVFAGIQPYERFFWYLYYVPNPAIPLVSYFMTLYIGRPENWRMPKKYLLLLIPCAALSLGIVTNDLHFKAFWFDDLNASTLGGAHHVTYLYFVVQAWLLLFTVLPIVRLYQVCRAAGLQVYLRSPVIVAACGILYTILYTINRSPYGVGFIESRNMTYVVSIGVWEACLSAGLIPSNRFYPLFFNASTVPMKILDANAQVRFQSAGVAAVGQDESREFRERRYEIPFGELYYEEDVTDSMRVLNALEKAAAERNEANRKLEAEAKIKRDTLRVQEKMRLYDKALGDVKNQIDTLKQLIFDCRQAKGAEAEELLARVAFYAAYVKRRSNLVLISEAHNELPVQELHFCLRETNETLALIPVSTVYRPQIAEDSKMNAERIREIYDEFEETLERFLPILDRMRLELVADEAGTTVTMAASGRGMRSYEMRWQA